LFFPEHFSRQAAELPGSNAGRAPLGVIAVEHSFPWDDDHPPVHTSDLVTRVRLSGCSGLRFGQTVNRTREAC
jgi:hypothetical protein